MTSVRDQYYAHDFTEATAPGNSESWYSPKPKGKFLEPTPSDPSWTLAYEISASGNTLNNIVGTVLIDRHVDTVIEFRYQIDEMNGAAWYSMAVWYYPNVGVLPFGADQQPSLITQIGNVPAEHVS